ncbi:hypothetical protein [Allomuricauda sp. F6463D]|uniref:hypothetical protein n=1 Tax=Allomuricauda sp. F6463D TaxID=2926409 RepID=UPI001FF4834F|nr:hypothetical protein [Muricauda sp. F6463D]MCK0161665.1 hypothetical protein [Muricauda sp. F6463D]
MTSKIEKIKIPLDNKEINAHKLTVASEIPINIEIAWKKVTTSALLEFVAKGKIKFIPTAGKFPEKWKQGMTVTTKMIAYGFIPFGGLHTLYFSKIDEEIKVMETKEKDIFAKVWNHKISMKSTGENSIYYKDEIIIYGGVLTGFISWWAKSFYKHRQKRWQLLAKNKLKLNNEN